MRTVDWYFDYISPFSYFQLTQFDRLPADVAVTYRPILFAGLLNHWEHKGPAEIPSKRVHTYRWCQWFAMRHGIPFRFPPAHPFNPLRTLRLTHALDCDPAVVRTIFDTVWAEGADTVSDEGWHALTATLGVADADARVSDPAVKEQLRQATEDAAARGVFGVPTFAIDGELIWGVDSTDMVLDVLADPSLLRVGEMARVSTLPIAKARQA